MSTVYRPGSGRVTASFAAVAKLYGVGVDICLPVPARQPQGRGGEGLPAAQHAHAGEEAFGDECFVLAF